MTLHQLRLLLGIKRYLSFTKASEALHISQPSVSHQIKQLEEEYEIELFKKNGKGIQPTQAGRKFTDYAEKILSLVDDLDGQFKNRCSPWKNKPLKIGATHSSAMLLLPSILPEFNEAHPEARLIYQTTDASNKIEELVLDCEIEIALINNPSYLSSIVYDFYQKEQILAVVSKDHSLADRKSLTLAELAGKPVIVKNGKRSPSVTEKFLTALQQRGCEMNPIMSCGTVGSLRAAVKAGMGIGILYKNVIEDDLRRGELKVIDVPVLNRTADICVIHHKYRPLSPMAKDFLTFMSERRQSENNNSACLDRA
ncbi:MAG: LysR family transcriptional regulator [Candidatus Binatia bacterium]